MQGRSETVSVTTNKRNQKDKEEYIIVRDTHEAIITRTDFKAVQQLINSRKKLDHSKIFTCLLIFYFVQIVDMVCTF
ncbi:hypothetical protein FDC45_03470 [Clostridium botulinum]|uniref:Recombinase domain-containing protein n=1 Tax=Clostridium botulinum TaxID=1491 RepID=A0A846J6Z1_CLOBO|nr:hypothetical protein [Clostridium botulinum]NFJ08971.1 hypothetical protein [Clostridium botulinum]NFK16239.1 hypothetical protein [Clostridium botulinum]NFM92460.1 hypothetical protein [Clostridium botulinum]NFO16446.1 hypothetical protein [Clostridium botulinum]